MTNGELLYRCLLQVRPTQFAEGAATTEPRTPWEDLTEKTQWSQAEWEKIAEDFLSKNSSSMDGEVLYASILRVCPEQRRVLSVSTYRRPSWSDQWPERQARWHQIAKGFLSKVNREID